MSIAFLPHNRRLRDPALLEVKCNLRIFSIDSEPCARRRHWNKQLIDIDTGTTSIGPVTSTAFFYLLYYPKTLERLISEIRTTFASEDEICIGPKLSSCEYLWAVVDETLRLTPIVSNPIFRTVPKGGCVVAGEFFDESTELGASVWAVHRDEHNFAGPHGFRRERYLAATPEGRKGRGVEAREARGRGQYQHDARLVGTQQGARRDLRQLHRVVGVDPHRAVVGVFRVVVVRTPRRLEDARVRDPHVCDGAGAEGVGDGGG